VLIRVIVVVPEDDMVARLPLGFFLGGLALFFDGTLVDVGGRGFEYSGTGLITHGVSFLTARVAYRHGLLRRSLIVAKTVGHYIVRRSWLPRLSAPKVITGSDLRALRQLQPTNLSW